MKFGNAARLSLAIASGTLIGACGFFARPQTTEYYLLDYVPTPPKERLEKGPYPYVVRVRDCSIAEAYRRSQIVYRQSANQIQFYGLHLWAVDPDRMVTDLVTKHLKAARLFDNVTRTVENYVPDYFLSCDIQAIEEYDNKDQWYAHMAIEYQLENAKSNQIVWKKLYDLRKDVRQQEPVYIVRGLSFLVENINDRLVKELEVVLDEARYKNRARSDSAVTDTLSGGAKP